MKFNLFKKRSDCDTAFARTPTIKEEPIRKLKTLPSHGSIKLTYTFTCSIGSKGERFAATLAEGGNEASYLTNKGKQ